MACTAVHCGAAASTLYLACEKTDSILAVAAVGIDFPAYVPSCNSDFSTNSSSVCDLAGVQKSIEDQCVGLVSCDLDVPKLVEGACQSAPAGLRGRAWQPIAIGCLDGPVPAPESTASLPPRHLLHIFQEAPTRINWWTLLYVASEKGQET